MHAMYLSLMLLAAALAVNRDMAIASASMYSGCTDSCLLFAGHGDGLYLIPHCSC